MSYRGARVSGGSATPIVTIQNIKPTSNYTQTSNVAADVTGMTVTLPNRANGKAMITFTVIYSNAAIGASDLTFQILDAAAVKEVFTVSEAVATQNTMITMGYSTTLSGQIVKLQFAGDNVNICTIIMSSSTIGSRIDTLEIS